MMPVQRKYKIIKKTSAKELAEEVNQLIQREYKDQEGFIFQSSGRWQCLGGPLCENGDWLQAVVFLQEEKD